MQSGNGLSLIQDARTIVELERLRPGVVTTVQPIPNAVEASSFALPQFAGTAPGKATLARLTSNGLLISLLLEGNDSAGYGPVPVEITWRWHEGTALRITAVKRGKRRIRSDIPNALLVRPSSPTHPTIDIFYQSGLTGLEVGTGQSLLEI